MSARQKRVRPKKLDKAKIYLDLATKTDIGIQQANQRLNDKIKSMITLASALIPTVAGLGYFIAKETSSYWILVFVFLSIGAFVSAIALGIMLFTGSSYLYVDPKVVNDKYSGKSFRYFVNKLASNYCDVANKNAEVVNSKHVRINWMNKCIVTGLGIFGFSFLLLAISLTLGIFWFPCFTFDYYSNSQFQQHTRILVLLMSMLS